MSPVPTLSPRTPGPIGYFAGVQNLLDQRYVVPVLSETAFSQVPQ